MGIEVGSLVFSMDAMKRQKNITISGAKTNIGHVESGAGMVGLIRCILACLTTRSFPNVHLFSLNGHFQMEGFPALLCTENITTGCKSNINGVSSFGFGGTNSRAEMFACAKLSTASVIDRTLVMPQTDNVLRRCPKCLGTMCWVCGEAMSGAGEHICSLVRDEAESYDLCSACYRGSYQFGSNMLGLPMPTLKKVFLTGSWDRFEQTVEMALDSSGVYRSNIVLGETRMERFRLSLDPMGASFTYPSEGTVYEVTFQWTGNIKSVAWEVAANAPALPEEAVRTIARSQHVYSLALASNDWAFCDMEPDNSDAALWSLTSTMCLSGEDEFVLVRDHDWGQTIYPNTKTWDTLVPVMGPGARSLARVWAFSATPESPLTFQVRVVNGSIAVMVTADSAEARGVKKVWRSLPMKESAGHTYSITGSFNDWGFIDMARGQECETYRCIFS